MNTHIFQLKKKNFGIRFLYPKKLVWKKLYILCTHILGKCHLSFGLKEQFEYMTLVQDVANIIENQRGSRMD